MWLLRLRTVADAEGAPPVAATAPHERDAYERRVYECRGEGPKATQQIADYRETHARLVDAMPSGGTTFEQLATSVVPTVAHWEDGSDEGRARPLLRFAPGNIDTCHVTRALAHCDAVMYGAAAMGAASRIDVVIDLTDVDAGRLGALTRACSRKDLRDGLRLWACLPFAVESVVVVLPQRSPLLGAFVASLTRMLLNEKMRRKVRCSVVRRATAA